MIIAKCDCEEAMKLLGVDSTISHFDSLALKQISYWTEILLALLTSFNKKKIFKPNSFCNASRINIIKMKNGWVSCADYRQWDAKTASTQNNWQIPCNKFCLRILMCMKLKLKSTSGTRGEWNRLDNQYLNES